MLVSKIVEVSITVPGRIFKIWHLYCEQMLIKTKDIGIKTRTDLI